MAGIDKVSLVQRLELAFTLISLDRNAEISGYSLPGDVMQQF